MIMFKNHLIERVWHNINQQVNYSIEAALLELVDADRLHTDDELVKFCIS